MQTISVVDLSPSRDTPVWYHNQLLAMRDCWARGVAGGAAWSASLDLDEFLVVPLGWASAPAFASAPSLSFASVVPCSQTTADAISFHKEACVPTHHGHRKYVLRAAAPPPSPQGGGGLSKTIHGVLGLRPPGYIHGDPLEYRLSAASGMFLLHFSRCPLAPFTKPTAPGVKSWQGALFQEKHWPMASLSDLQNSTSPPTSLDLAPCSSIWTY